MIFFSGFISALQNCFKGLGLLFKPRIWPYLIYTVIWWLFIWLFSVVFFYKLAEIVSERLQLYLNFESIPNEGVFLSTAKPFLTGYFSLLLTWIFKLMFWFISGTFSKYLTIITMSPLFSLLSQTIESQTQGTVYPFQLIQFLKDILRGVQISIRNMLLEYICLGLGFLMTLIFPPLAFVTVPFLFILSCYFIGFTMLDYNFERHQMTIRQSIKFTRQNSGLACGIGLVYLVICWIPFFIGQFFGPLVALAGATISFLNIKTKSTISSY